MTNGMSFPAGAAEQAELVRRLAAVGVSGLAIGEQMYCPELTNRFVRTSDEVCLPVLWISYPLPFASISRSVAEATLLEQSQRLMRTARIYDTLRRQTATGQDRSSIAEALSGELACSVTICDRETGEAYHPNGPFPATEVVDAVRLATSGGAALVAGARSVLLPDGAEVLVVEVPTHDQAVLVVVRPADVPLDGILLQHAATVAALELSQTRLGLEHARRAGAELMAQLLDGRADARTARRQLVGLGLDPSRSVVASLGGATDERLHEAHVRLWRKGIPHILALRSGTVHALLPGDEDTAGALEAALGPSGRIGISGPLRSSARVAEADREAVWAMGMAAASGKVRHRFGQATPFAAMGTLADAQALVDEVLGAVLAHDAEHNSELIETLEAYLANRRSWQQTAAALQVHRQTVLYRIKRVERLSGRTLAETGDLAQMWLALQARARLAGRG